MHSAKPNVQLGKDFVALNRYFVSSPSVCRVPQLVSELRIEVDTTEETGVRDWNCERPVVERSNHLCVISASQ